MSITLKTTVVITGINPTKERVFYSTDEGYPRWSASITSAKHYPVCSKIDTIPADSPLLSQIIKIEILRIETIATVVSTEEVVSEVKAAMMVEVNVLEQKLKEKTAALLAMK